MHDETTEEGMKVYGPARRTIVSSDQMTGKKVVNRQDENLGTLHDIMMDLERGTVAYAVLASGGFLGMGDKLFAIPWSALEYHSEQEHFVLDVDKEALKSAPGFERQQWPDLSNREEGDRIHKHYNVRPYWQR